MKQFIPIITLILLTNLISAATYELINHEPQEINGRIFELNGRGENQIYIDIDGKFTKVTKEYKYKNGVYLQLINYNDPYDNNPLTASVEISMDYTCGNDECEIGESQYCCTDCNCTDNFTCLQNQCIANKFNLCFTDIDCDDNNPCTIDTCGGLPLNCNHTFTTECVSGDDCCPIDCNKTIDYAANDWDCLPEPTCITDFDCNDSDETTIDLCDKNIKECKFEIMVVGSQPITELKKEPEQHQNQTQEKEPEISLDPQDPQQQLNKFLLIGLIIIIIAVLLIHRKLASLKRLTPPT